MAEAKQKRSPSSELEQYRTLLETPTEFSSGFKWTTVAGIFFCGLVMLPGSIYLGLMTGMGMGSAATWVTVILFMEISRRAMKAMGRQELVILLHAANVMIAANIFIPGGPIGEIIYRAFLVTSDAIRDTGMSESFPKWFVPSPESPAIHDRNLFHIDWLLPIGILFFITIIGKLNSYTLGYAFFRITSDVEKLPFPLAPISAQGSMALAESDDVDEPEASVAGVKVHKSLLRKDARKKSPKWRLFSLGASVGILYGIFQVGVPVISGLFLSKPVFIIPQPFLELTTLTESFLPSTPTGIVMDLGILLLGMVLPFWVVIGTFIAVAATMVLNPILHNLGILVSWQQGMNTVNTSFANSIDFWMSFGIGSGLGISAVSIYSMVRDIRVKMKEIKARRIASGSKTSENIWTTPKGRGDYPLWIAFCLYTIGALLMIWLCHTLVPQIPVYFLFIFTFIYNPFISYVNARLLGISGQNVDIPFIRETSFILSGAKGLDIWLAPIPIANYGGMAQSFRVNELTGVNFFSLLKADLVAIPVLFVLSFLFWAFIWHSNQVPSEIFPAAQINWELASKNQALIFSSTFVAPDDPDATRGIEDSEFMKAIHPAFIGTGFLFIVIVFGLLSAFNLPVLLLYGIVRGMGNLPHYFMLEIIGAIIGQFILKKRFGEQNFLRMIPIILAGYYTGVGLIGMGTIAFKLIAEAVSGTPF